MRRVRHNRGMRHALRRGGKQVVSGVCAYRREMVSRNTNVAALVRSGSAGNGCYRRVKYARAGNGAACGVSMRYAICASCVRGDGSARALSALIKRAALVVEGMFASRWRNAQKSANVVVPRDPRSREQHVGVIA